MRAHVRRAGALFAAILSILAACDGAQSGFVSGVSHAGAGDPALAVSTFIEGLDVPWDVVFTSDDHVLITERGGVLKVRRPNGTVTEVAIDLSDFVLVREVGLLGLTLDPAFATNRRFYTCQGHTGPEAQVISWTMAPDYASANRVDDPLVGTIPVTDGRHVGCRLLIDNEGHLVIATGDAATGTVPQDLTSLGGKVLRVDRLTGEGVSSNPFSSSPNANTRRIWSWGHRNIQGLAMRPTDRAIWTAEHGPDVDDEVNRVRAGNAGWNPVPGYNEQVPMTDLNLPDAYPARWSTGDSTLALSGATFLDGPQWKSWNGALAVTTLKNTSLEILFFDHGDVFIGMVSRLEGAHGRMRVPVQGPDGNLYIAIDSSENGRVIEVTPS